MEAHQDFIDPFAEGACTTQEDIPRILSLKNMYIYLPPEERARILYLILYVLPIITFSYTVYNYHRLVSFVKSNKERPLLMNGRHKLPRTPFMCNFLRFK